MINQERLGDALPPETLTALIHTALRRKKDGDQVGARALLRALSLQQPDEARIWLALATVAETRAEQYQALARVIALDPQHPLAQRGLERFAGAVPPPPPGRPAADRTTPVLPSAADLAAEQPAPRDTAALASQGADTAFAPTVLKPVAPRAFGTGFHWFQYLAIALAVFAVLVVAGLLRLSPIPAAGPVATPALGQAQVSPERATAAASGVSTSQPSAATPASAAARPSAAPATLTPIRAPTALPILAAGDLITRPPWEVSLLRPDYAVLLDGSIGTLQPKGRFVLTLVAVSNTGQVPARLPSDLFALVDTRGQRYLALSAASTIYLNTYGRGQRGDFSMEEDIPPSGGVYSVPLIFDVPTSAAGLTLHVGTMPAGWLISDSARINAPAPTPTP
jgi:hypothetical protein